MNSVPLPCPKNPKVAKLLLDFIWYGLIMMDIKVYPDHITFLIKTPERIHTKQDTISGVSIASKFRTQLIQSGVYGNAVVVKRAPYRNTFDDWIEEYGEAASREYRMLLSLQFSDSDLS